MALTTKIDAVNTILGAAGEAPVSSLSGVTMDVANAITILDEVSREVQSQGWTFNSETAVEYPPATDKTITLPQTVLVFDAVKTEKRRPVLRGSKVYDSVNHCYTFDTSVTADIISFLDWELLPELARRYITTRAARIFHDRYIGSAEEHKFTQDDEQQARMSLVENFADDSDCTIFDSPDMRLRLLR